MLVVFPIVALFVRDRPQSIGLQPYGATEPVPVPERSEQPFRPAFDGLLLGARSRTFWLLSSGFFICGLSTNGLIGTHLIPASIDHHMTEVAGASLLALMGLFDVVGTTVSGWLTDRLDPRRLLAWYYALRGLAVIALPVAFGTRLRARRVRRLLRPRLGRDRPADGRAHRGPLRPRAGRASSSAGSSLRTSSVRRLAAWAGGASRTWFGTTRTRS